MNFYRAILNGLRHWPKNTVSHMVTLLAAFALTSAAAGNELTNGSFEEGPADQTPKGWGIDNSGNAQVTLRVTEGQSADGKRAMLIVNQSGQKPNVFCALRQNVKLKPGFPYQLSFKVKGSGDGLLAVLSQRWNIRYEVTNLTGEWARHTLTFTPEAADFDPAGFFPVRLISEKTAAGIYLDDVTLESAGAQVISPENFQKKHLYLAPRITQKISAISEIPYGMPVMSLPAGAEYVSNGKMPAYSDLHARVAMGWSAEGLTIIAEVNDQSIVTGAPNELWLADSVQLRIEQSGLRGDATQDDVEITLAPVQNGPNNWSWPLNRALNKDEAKIVTSRRQGGYVVAGQLTWSYLNRIGFTNKKPFSFNVIVNDVDAESKERRVAFLASGIHQFKSNRDNTLILFDTGAKQIHFFPDQAQLNRQLSGYVVATHMQSVRTWDIPMTLTDSRGQALKISAGPFESINEKQIALSAVNRTSLETLADGQISLSMADAEGRTVMTRPFYKQDLLKTQLAVLDRMDKLVADTREELSHCGVRGQSRYFELLLAVLSRQSEEHRQTLTKDNVPLAEAEYLERGKIIAAELEQIAGMLRERMAIVLRGGSLPATWEYVSGPSQLENGWFKSRVADEQGHTREQNLFFIGYGHFSPAVKDLPYFQKIASNIIQIEIGPDSFFPHAGKDSDFSEPSLAEYERFIAPAMQRAWDNNSKICLLISPHYHPKWWLEKYPEVASESGFLRYEVNHPKARQMVEAYLRVFMPILAKSPRRDVIQSITLANEPVYIGATLEKEFTRGEYARWLKTRYKTIDAFNAACGTSFADFVAVANAGEDSLPNRYDFNIYKREAFAGWHAWMAGIVHEYWPEIPVHVKIMMAPALQYHPAQGIDPELFGQISTLNGNDNYFTFDNPGKWGVDWQVTAMGHDLQYSLKPVSIVNAENHVINDKEKRAIPYDHLYSATFQQLLQGVGTMATWVWVPLEYDGSEHGDFGGNIYHRPADIVAQGMAALDASRLVPQIMEYVQYRPRVAILYSPASYVTGKSVYADAMHKLYENLSFTGHKIGFLSDSQIKAESFGEYRVLMIPAAEYVDRDILKGLREFVHKGGLIYTYGSCFVGDQHGRPIDIKDIPLAKLSETDDQTMVRNLRKILDRVEPLAVKIMAPTEDDTRGIVWRTVPGQNHTTINLLNIGRTPREVTVQADAQYRIVDMITGLEVSGAFMMNPVQTRFLGMVRR